MEDPMLSPVTVEVTYTPSPRADLIVGHVAPAAVAQAHAAPSCKRQGNVVAQDGNPAAPVVTARAPGANAAMRSRPATEKVGKATGVKRRKFPATRKPPSSTSHSTPPPPQGGAPAMPFNDATPPASEVFDEMAGRYASFEPFDYNETNGGVDDHGCADELKEIEAEAFEQLLGVAPKVRELEVNRQRIPIKERLTYKHV
ncbi:hypothetical protein D1007_40813 [Hordeum vulgare]|nr:hypothetical protein D1007_40813 [Hordeum vulgare]